MKQILVIIFFLSIALISCNKNEKKKLTSDLLNLCFKTDTYWVYIDSVSNVVDSVYVVNYDHYFREEYVTDYTSYDIERFDFKTNSSTSKSIYFSIAPGGFVKYSQKYLTIIYVDKDQEFIREGYLYTRFDSVFVYDRYYKGISKVEVAHDESENDNKSIYYTNSEYGILRQDIYYDSTLISSKVLMRKNIIR